MLLLLLLLLLLLSNVLLLVLLLPTQDILWLLLLRWRALYSPANRGLNPPYAAQIHDTNRRARSRCILTNLLDLAWRKRATGISSQRRLLALERNRRRGRSGSRHHGPAQYRGRRARST